MAGHMIDSVSFFISAYCFSRCLYHFAFPPPVNETSSFSIFLPKLFNCSHSKSWQWYHFTKDLQMVSKHSKRCSTLSLGFLQLLSLFICCIQLNHLSLPLILKTQGHILTQPSLPDIKQEKQGRKKCLLLENNEMSVCISAMHLPTSDEF